MKKGISAYISSGVYGNGEITTMATYTITTQIWTESLINKMIETSIPENKSPTGMGSNKIIAE